ncbi:MAG: HAMP domain-containing histidine kinase [Kiritimatiellae bacterium]|nr:HAMP domain-containing histidine kinase [Kiritimatiellia bacterium]
MLPYAGAFAVCLAVLFFALGEALRRRAIREVDGLLVSEAERILDLAARRKAGIVEQDMRRYVEHYGKDNVLLRLFSSSGELLACSDTEASGALARAVLVRAPPPAPVARFRSDQLPSGARVRSVYLSSHAGHRVQVCRSLAALETLLRTYRLVLLLGFGVCLAAGTALASGIAAGAVARLERVRLAAERIYIGNLRERIPVPGGADEVGALAVTFNTMIERIACAVDELRVLMDNMAHDFRTPLTRMRAAAEAAVASNANAEGQQEALALVVEECDRLERMVSTILQIARMEAGADTIAKRAVAMDEVVRAAVELYGPLVEDRGLDLSVECEVDRCGVLGDRPLLERMLANLLDNAVKFTPTGGRVGVSCRPAEGRWLELVVEDTGSGIPPEDLPHVFERFFRSDRTRHMDGSGLGLSFVHAAAKAHGGEVRMTSRLGTGTRVFVRLPLAQP